MDAERGEERRVWERFPARFPAKLKDSRQEYGEVSSLRNASAAGFRMTSQERFFVNDKVSMEVKLPDERFPLALNGEVVWVKGKDPDLWDVGVKLHKIDFLSMARLYKFVVLADT